MGFQALPVMKVVSLSASAFHLKASLSVCNWDLHSILPLIRLRKVNISNLIFKSFWIGHLLQEGALLQNYEFSFLNAIQARGC
jgi:hypothetical protein